MLLKGTVYLLAIIGIAGLLAIAIPPLKASIKFPSAVPESSIVVISVFLVIIGVFLAYKLAPKKGKIDEVPIHHGKNVVGYRRVHNK